MGYCVKLSTGHTASEGEPWMAPAMCTRRLTGEVCMHLRTEHSWCRTTVNGGFDARVEAHMGHNQKTCQHA